jgi:hypothetical protein
VLTAVISDPSEFSQGPDQSTSQKIQQALQPFFVQKDGKMVFDPKALTFYDQEMGAKYEVMSRQAQTWRTQADQMTDPTLKQAYTKMAEAAEKKIDPAFKRFNEVKAWMAKTDLRTIANNTASGACNAIAYYLLAASAGKETRTFQQFFTDELRHGNISLGHIQRREGGRTITVTGAFKATGSGNWDKKYRIHREANLSQAQRNLGNNEITFAIVYYDTGRKPDGYPDHFFIIQKNSRGEWINQDHASSNPARRGGATDWNRVYEVRYIR